MANSLRNCLERIQCKSMVQWSEFDCCRSELASSSGFMHDCQLDFIFCCSCSWSTRRKVPCWLSCPGSKCFWNVSHHVLIDWRSQINQLTNRKCRYGQFFFVWIRAVVATIWFGVQSYFGSQLLSVLLRCVFGESWWHMTNHLPASAGITSRDLLAFFLFWILEMPFLVVHPRKIKFLFAAESIICPLACIGVFSWCVSYGGGIRMNSLASTTEAKGGALGWAMLNGINSCLGVTSALLVNQPDLTRYTRRPKDAGWRQASSIFLSKTLIFFFGIGATAAVQGKFGHAYWNQWDLLNAILDRFWGPAARAGCFFASFGFALSVLGVNIGCNAIPFGADVTGLVPKLLTIVRGQICCGVLSLAIVPWKLLSKTLFYILLLSLFICKYQTLTQLTLSAASGSAFLIFLGSYNCFISPICAIIIVDYFFIKRGNIHTPSLFNPSNSSLYFYTGGWNLRALGCWVCSAVFGIPGLIGAYHPTWVAMAATHIYQTGWVICFTAAAVLYYAVNLVFRAEVLPYGQATSEFAFEHLAATEGYLEGENVVEFPILSLRAEDSLCSEHEISTVDKGAK
ncbi:related to uracil permease [Fusarium mangiferae]|uniref:Related to uracil permease n=1 Tax=Fusarium mangiferae TaxID=192010 RepID=A0A1L7UG28_FUSMA|nr:uncharacterized protein FMAN_12061 [Fusarium mangiferae]CVL06975.1 related to uracil permease [Fusarium mangiferae]